MTSPRLIVERRGDRVQVYQYRGELVPIVEKCYGTPLTSDPVELFDKLKAMWIANGDQDIVFRDEGENES